MKRILFLISAALFLLSYQGHCQTITDTGTLRSALNADIVTNGSKLITASKLNRVMNGILNTMHSYGVDSAYIINPDTLVLTRRGGYSNYKIKLPGLGSGAESDPTVSGAAKAIVNGDTTNWSTAYRKRLSNLSFDSASKILTVTLSDGTEFKDTINIVGGGGGGSTNLGQSRTSTTYTVTSSSGVPTTLQPADNSNAGVLTSNQKKLLDTLANPDSVRLYRKPGSDSVFLCVKPYPYTLESCKFQYRDTLGAGGGGSGDVVGPSSATDGQLVKQNGTTGKVVNNYTGTGYVKTSTGVPSPVTTIPNADVVNFKSYPTERTFGTIYEKSSWKDLSDFAISGEVNIALNGDKVDFSSTDIDYTNRIRFIPWWSTGTNQWKVTVQYKVTVAGGTWCGPDIKSQVNHDGANFDVMGFKSFGTGTSSFIYDGTGTTQYSTLAAPASSIGDLMEVTFRRDDSTIIYTIKNITTSSATTTHTYSYPSNQSVPMPNVGQWGWMVSGTSGTGQFQYIKVEILGKQYPTLTVIGNSKAAVGYADSWAGRLVEKLNTTYPTTTWSAGSAENLTDIFLKLPEILQVNPQQVLCLDCWSNSVRAGTPINLVVDSLEMIYKEFANGGTKFLFAPLPEDSTVNGAANLTAMKNYLVANHASEYIDTWTPLSSSNKLLLAFAHSGADKVHLNQAGQDAALSAIISSGLISTIDINRRVPWTETDANIQTVGGRLRFRYPIFPAVNTLPKFDDKYRLVRSVFQDNGTTAFVSTKLNPVAPSTNGRLNVDGAVYLYGTQGQLKQFDATNPADNFTFQYDAHVYRTISSGTNIFSVDNTGKWRISPTTTGTYTSAFQIKQDYNFSYTSGFNGLQFQIGATTHNYAGNTALPDISTAYIDQTTLTASGVTTYPWGSALHIKGPMIAGANVSFTNGALALYVEAGMTYAKGGLRFDLGSDANYDLYYRNSSGLLTRLANGTNGQFLGANTSAAPSWQTPSAGGGITGTLTSGRIPYATGTSTVADNSNFLWDNTNQRVSIGTTTAVGHLNVGGNVTWSGSQAGLQAYFLGATYNDNTTATSGTAAGSANPILIGAPTFTATNTGVIQPNAYTMYISKPIAGTNVTIQQNRALIVEGLQTTSFYVQVNGATDANYTITSDDYYINLPTITANRTVTLPASPGSGRKLIIKNKNSAGFAWQFSTAVKDGADASVTNLVNDTVYELIFDGTDWNIVN